MKEVELQKALKQIIEKDQLIESIVHKDQLDEALKVYSDPNYIPNFEVDSLLRKRYSESAKRSLESLYIYDIISLDGLTNLSLDKRERLLPDCILFNPETQQIIVIENKATHQATRQTITELFGYAQEIRNHIPFASHLEITYIIISSEYPALLDHSVAGQLLSTNFNMLCLVPHVDKDGLKLSIHFPRSWTDIGQDYLSENGLVSFSLCMKAKTDTIDDDELRDHLRVACDLLMHEAQRFETSGIYLLWANTIPQLDYEYGLTIYMLNPFSFVTNDAATTFVSGRKSPLLSYLLENSEMLNAPASLTAIAGKSREYLENFFDVHWDRSTNWTIDVADEDFCVQRLPLNQNSWGMIGEFIRDSYLHPAVRRHYLLSEELSGNGYLTSFVSFQLLTQITGTHLFRKGEFHHRDLFAFGIQLQKYASLCNHILTTPDFREDLAEADLFWQGLAVLTSLKEISVRMLDIKKEVPPGAVFTISLKKGGVPAEQIEKIKAFVEWFDKEFLGLNRSHRRLFTMGFEYAAYFTTHRSNLNKSEVEKIEGDVANYIKMVLISFLDSLHKKEREVSSETLTLLKDSFELSVSSKKKVFKQIAQHSNNFYTTHFDDFLKFLQLEIGEVFHDIEPWRIPDSVDWTWFTKTASDRFKEGKLFTVFELTSNGTVQIGQLNPQERIMGRLTTADQVFFKFNQAGLSTIILTTWSDLKSGNLQY